VLKAKEMNVYLYGGNSRFNATIPLVKGNEAVETGKTYTIDAAQGMLLIAYPNQDVDTDFEFVYQLVPKVDKIQIPIIQKLIEDVDESKLNLIAIVLVAVVVSLMIFCIYLCCAYKRR